MNYRHIYHAGNFADIVKHIILISIINNLKLKAKPFAVLDAFAGIGLYDLKDERPNKTKEYNNGIGLFYELQSSSSNESLPALINQYLNIIKDFNSGNDLEYYPGSPMIISYLMRRCDSLIASELHKDDYLELKENMSSTNAKIHNICAYNAIKAFCPPKEKRGLIFIDPAFEVQDEFKKLIAVLQHTKSSFLNGLVMIWLPIKDTIITNDFYQKYKLLGYKESLLLEFEIAKNTDVLDNKMNKFGILIANPPYIQKDLTEALDYLVNIVYQGRAKYILSRF